MGNVSIIARRLADGHVQYGYGGSGGFMYVGARLLLWYQKPEDVEYLFGLGQTEQVGQVGSEYGGFPMFQTHMPTGNPFWLGNTENDIFNKIMFYDYVYFYDLDNTWYYICTGPISIKVPLELVANFLDEKLCEYTFISLIKDLTIKLMLTYYRDNCPDFQKLLNDNQYNVEKIYKDIVDTDNYNLLSISKLYNGYPRIFDYFDDWIVVVADEKYKELKNIIIRKREKVHIETCNWKC